MKATKLYKSTDGLMGFPERGYWQQGVGVSASRVHLLQQFSVRKKICYTYHLYEIPTYTFGI